MENNLDSFQTIRQKISEIDREIIDALARRAQLARQLGILKRENNLPVRDEAREKELFLELEKIALESGISQELVHEIWGLILRDSILEQEKIFRSDD